MLTPLYCVCWVWVRTEICWKADMKKEDAGHSLNKCAETEKKENVLLQQQ